MDLTNKTIMIVDDSILARKQLKDTINNYAPGATFVDAANGVEAAEQYKQHKPDLSFIDIVMPEKSGIEAISEITAIDADAVLVVVSSIGTQEQLKKAIMAGAKDFVQKPLSPDHIYQIIDSRLGGN